VVQAVSPLRNHDQLFDSITLLHNDLSPPDFIMGVDGRGRLVD